MIDLSNKYIKQHNNNNNNNINNVSGFGPMFWAALTKSKVFVYSKW